MGWTQDELVEFLKRKGVPESAYSFHEAREDAMSIDKVGDLWRIYYVERGVKLELAWAKSEAQALDVLKLFLLEATGRL